MFFSATNERSLALQGARSIYLLEELTEYLAQTEHTSNEDADGDEELVAGAERSSQVEGSDLGKVHGRQTRRKTCKNIEIIEDILISTEW